MPDNSMKKYYDLLGTTVELCFNNRTWLESASIYLFMPECKNPSLPADIKLNLLEAAASEADRLAALPGRACRLDESILLLSEPVKTRYYTRDLWRWVDYEGYGRVCLDYARGEATAVRYSDSGFDPFYSDILFTYNLLSGLLIKAGFFSIHASCVNLGGQGVLFTGNSGKGKSTAAFALMRQGYPALSDDRVLITRKETYLGVAISDVIKLRRQAALEFFPYLAGDGLLHELDGELYLKASSLQKWHDFKIAVPVQHLFILERTGQPHSSLSRINPARVVGDLFPVTLSTWDSGNINKKFLFIMEFLGNINCWRVSFGTDMNEFAGVIEKAVLG